MSGPPVVGQSSIHISVYVCKGQLIKPVAKSMLVKLEVSGNISGDSMHMCKVSSFLALICFSEKSTDNSAQNVTSS